MSKCGKYWQKVQDIEDEMNDVQKQVAEVDRHLLAKPVNPAPHIKHKQMLLEKAKLLGKKKESAYSAAVSCEAKAQQDELKKEKQQGQKLNPTG